MAIDTRSPGARGDSKTVYIANASGNLMDGGDYQSVAASQTDKKLGATGKTLVTDVAFDDNFNASARNIAGVSLVPSGRLTARDVMDTQTIIATRAAVERLQEVLG